MHHLNQMTKICTDPSGLPDLRWVAKLSNGQTVWQDDRDGGNSWRDLKKYVEDNRLSVVALQVEFRSHIVECPSGFFAYYFNKGARASFNSMKECFIVGYGTKSEIDVGVIPVYFYYTPELEVASTDVRDITLEANSRNLIINACREPDGKI